MSGSAALSAPMLGTPVCVCVCVCVWRVLFVSVSVYACVHMCVHTYTYVPCTNVSECVCVCVCVCMCHRFECTSGACLEGVDLREHDKLYPPPTNSDESISTEL